MEDYIDEELSILEKNGSSFDKKWLLGIKKQALAGCYNLDQTIDEILIEICEGTIDFINSGVVSGLSTGIYLDDNPYNFTIYGGHCYYDKKDKIDEDTLFDIASITKLFTLLLTFKLEELGYLNLDTIISKYNFDFKLGDFTIDDLVKMFGVIRTDKRIDECKNKEEAYQVLKEIKIVDTKKDKPHYTDMGMIVLSSTIEKIVSEKKHQKLSFDEIMDMYLLQPLGLNNTTFKPHNNIAGTGNKLIIPNDQKAQILGPIGSAGLFSNSYDLAKLFNKLYHSGYLNDYHLNKLNQKLRFNSSRGYAGINLKHPEGIIKSFAPNEYSDKVYAEQGWTGCVVINDPLNKIHNNFLVSSIKENERKKPNDFMKYYNDYQLLVVRKTLTLLLLKKIYNKYYNCNEKKEKVIKLS